MDVEAGQLGERADASARPTASVSPTSLSPTSVSPAGGDELMFPAVARLELDELLSQLVERAQDVMATQSRLRGLLQANRVITTDLRLPVVLHRIAEAARELLDARYAALGVVAADLRLEQFIHVGMTPQEVARVGHLPTGKGVLGLLVTQPQPQRLADITRHPQAHGFPPGHPTMRTFIGVPIRLRTEVFGNLYVAEKRDGRPFTAEDEELALALAASAGVAIENARLFQESQQRQQWLTASADVTRHLMADGDEPLWMIVRTVQAVAEADFAAFLLDSDTTDQLTVEVAVGVHAEGLIGTTIDRDRSVAGRALRERRPLLLTDATAEVPVGPGSPELGPLMAVPLSATGSGVLLIGRLAGRHPFTDGEIDMAAGFAGQIAVALELARGRAERDRLAVLEDRDRIARDLHDHVIQRLFAVALGMQDMARYEDPVGADRLAGYVEDLDATIREIRGTVFELKHTRAQGNGVRAQIAKAVRDLHPAFGFKPRVHTQGPLDTLVDGILAENLLAAVREGLSNAARHAHCSSLDITVSITGEILILEIVDDGDGMGQTTRRSGLANLHDRAEALGGSFSVTSGPTGGTHLRWTAAI